MELVGGIEPPTSSLPRTRSTPELHEQLSSHAVPQRCQKTVSRPGKAGGKLTVQWNLSKKISRKSVFFIRSRKPFQNQMSSRNRSYARNRSMGLGKTIVLTKKHPWEGNFTVFAMPSHCRNRRERAPRFPHRLTMLEFFLTRSDSVGSSP